MSDKLDKVIVVKLGGATLGSHDTIIEDMVALQKQDKLIVVVHGGGKIITDWLLKEGISTQFVKGQRVTNRATLSVVTAVLAGLVNKEIVAQINDLGGRAIGISGVDGSLIEGRIMDRNLGYTGTIVKMNLAPLAIILRMGYIPVVAPVSMHSIDKVKGELPLLNINADAVAGEIAVGIEADKLIFLTDVAGIKDSSGKLISKISPAEADTLMASGVISGGMIPKVNAGLRALAAKSTTSIIDGSKPHALLKEVEEKGSGTMIQRSKE